MTRRGWLLFAAMGIIWGIPYLLIKVAVGDLTPASLVFFRTGIGALILLPFAVSRGNISVLRGQWRPLVAYTLVEVSIPWFLLSDAEQRIPSSLAGLLIAAVPLVGAVMAWGFQRQDRLDTRSIVGLLIGFAGVASLLGLDTAVKDFSAVGEIAIVSVCYAAGPMIVARRLQSAPAVGVIAVSLGLTCAIYAPVGLLQVPHHIPSAAVLLSVLSLGVVCTALAFILFFALIATAGPVRSTVITYLNPAVALALGVILLHEPLSVGIVAGFALILIGSIVTNRRSAPEPATVSEDRGTSSSTVSEIGITTSRHK